MFQEPLTGRKVFIIFASFFGVIIFVNLILAFMAIRTFPGVETRSSFATNQSFNEDRDAQLALGWDVSARVAGDELILSIRDAEGRAVQPIELAGIFGHATNVRDDQRPAFVFDGSDFRAPVESDAGNWNLRLTATADDGTAFRQRLVVLVD
ncbi:MAG: FixH family protein [Rubellimicrobium sp.]|nr:FixH family protein [Rubellimicrobium sp.]